MGVTVAMQDHRVNYVIKERNIYEKRSVRDVHKVDNGKIEALERRIAHMYGEYDYGEHKEREGAKG